MDMKTFASKSLAKDPYLNAAADIRLEDISLKQPVTPKLSIIMSVFHRRTQLQRTLETLCRQTFTDFEVLIFDNDDDQNIQGIAEQFKPYLHIKYVKKEIAGRYFDPSLAINTMLPFAEGEVVAIMQPECMLHPTATWWLYHGHFMDKDDLSGKNIITNKLSLKKDLDGETCVALKTLFSSKRMQGVMDKEDWHSAFEALYLIDGFWEEKCGLSNFSNQVWKGYKESSWWFVQSYKRSAKLWDHIPLFRGHAGIDFFLITYRHVNDYLDIMPIEALAFHQDHHRMSFAPVDDQPLFSKEYIIQNCKE